MQILEEIQQPHHPQEHNQQQQSAKYYQFYTVATILEHVIDCIHTIVSDETNPYHAPISWLSRRQIRPPEDELFHDIIDECSAHQLKATDSFSSSICIRLEKASPAYRQEIVSRTRDGCAPLFIACKYGKLKMAKYLLTKCDADVEQRGLYETIEDHHVHSVSPVWIAAISGHLELVRLLLEYRANLNSLSDTGSTPLRSVCFLCKDDDSLSVAGYDLQNAQDPLEHPQVELNFFEDQKEDKTDKYFQIVQFLIDNGADPSIPNYNGGTCLINSIHNLSLTNYLLNHNCDVNASDYKSKTALHYAIEQNRIAVVKLLLSRGADPLLKANPSDDALQLCCLGGNDQIFKHLIDNVHYPNERLVDAYKLFGSTILEAQYDLSRVRQYWEIALNLKLKAIDKSDSKKGSAHRDPKKQSTRKTATHLDCDKRQILAYGDIAELDNRSELLVLTADEFRIQSLLMSERILGSSHRETLQRLLHRGTFYLNCLRPDRCINLWIYALALRLRHESIFHFESIFSAQAIAKLFSDLLSQNQSVNYCDVYDLLLLLLNQLEGCQQHLMQRPVSNLHEDIFDILLAVMANLLLAIKIVESRRPAGARVTSEKTRNLVRKLARLDPRSSDGSSFLHICVNLDVFYGDLHKLLVSRCAQLRDESGERWLAAKKTDNSCSPVCCLIDTLIESGLEVDSTNHDGLSPLQALCLSSTRLVDKQIIIKRLVECGAHPDRRPMTNEQGEQIRQSLFEAGVNPNKHLRLSCLAARKLAEQQRALKLRRFSECQKQVQAHQSPPENNKSSHPVLSVTADDCRNKEIEVHLSRQLRELIAIH